MLISTHNATRWRHSSDNGRAPVHTVHHIILQLPLGRARATSGRAPWAGDWVASFSLTEHRPVALLSLEGLSSDTGYGATVP